MRKLSLAALAALALLLPAGCGGDNDKPAENQGADNQTANAPEGAPAPAPAAPAAPAPGTSTAANPADTAAPANTTQPAAPTARVTPGKSPTAGKNGAAMTGTPAPKLELIETKYIPQSAVAAMVVHPQMILDSELLKNFINDDVLQQFQQKTMIDPRSVQRVTAVFWAADDAEGNDDKPASDKSDNSGAAAASSGGLRFVAFQNEDEDAAPATDAKKKKPAADEDSPFPAPGDNDLGPAGLPVGPGAAGPRPDGGFIARFARPFDVTSIKETPGKGDEKLPVTWETSEFEGKTIHLGTSEGETLAFYQPDPQTVVGAQKEDDLKKMLSTKGQSPVGRLLSKAELTHALVTVFDVQAIQKQAGPAAAQSGEYADKLETGILYADMPSDVRLAVVLEAIDEATPQQMLKDLETAMDGLRAQLPEMAKSPPFGPQMAQMAETLLNQTEPTAKGKVFTVNVTIPRQTIMTVMQLAPLFMQGMMGGGQPPLGPPPGFDNGPPQESLPELPNSLDGEKPNKPNKNKPADQPNE